MIHEKEVIVSRLEKIICGSIEIRNKNEDIKFFLKQYCFTNVYAKLHRCSQMP